MTLPDDTRERLLDAGGQVFAEKGFERATVREICQRAQANLAAVNYYFRDKERLYIETVKAACHSQTERNAAPGWPAGTPATVKLRDFIRAFFLSRQDVDERAWQRQLFLRELAQPTAACAELVRDHIRPRAADLGAILAELLPGVSERKRRLTAFSIVGQCIFYRVATPIVRALAGEEEYRTYDAQLLAEHVTQFTLAALGLGQPVGQDADPDLVGTSGMES